jgi:hypothetical protein
MKLTAGGATRAASRTIVLAALAVATACAAGPAPRPQPSPVVTPAFLHTLPPNFATRPTWSVQVTADTSAKEHHLVANALGVTGDAVVVPTVEAGAVNGSRVSLQFRDAATGRLRRSQPLPVGSLDGMAPDRVDGRPVVVVWHTSNADPQAGEVKQTTVFGADGSPVWDSAGRARLVTDRNSYPVFSNGYSLTANADGSTDALDTKGSVVLHVPPRSGAVSTAAGHLLVASVSGEYKVTVSFTLHDLTKGGATVATFTEPGSNAMGERGDLVGGTHDRPIVTWLGDGAGGMIAPTMIAVVDTASGRPAAPVPLPGFVLVSGAAAAVDESTGSALLYDPGSPPSASSLLVGLADGRIRWTQNGTGPLIPTSLHAGTIYGGIVDGAHSTVKAVSVVEATGEIAAQDYDLWPYGFTPSGAGIFVDSAAGPGGPLTVAAVPPARR